MRPDGAPKVEILHVTTVHPRFDMRILRKECMSLSAHFGGTSLFVADGLGNGSEGDVSIVDVGAPPGSRLRRIALQPWRMFQAVRRKRPQVVHLHDPELLPIGLLLAWSGLTVLYDAHEDVPRQILNKHWIPGPIRPLVSRTFEFFENFVARRLAGVVAATPHIAERFRVINSNTVDINNYPLPEELAPADSLSRKRQVCYVGGISRIRGIRPIIEALPLLPDVRLVLCGKFAEADFGEELRALPGWGQVDYLGHVDRDQVRKVMGESVAGMVTLFPIPNYLDSLPIKMFEYMSAELPVIASDFPLWKSILEDSEAGRCVDPNSPQAIASAIRELVGAPETVEALGKSGRKAVLTKYNWPTEAAKLIHFYQGVLRA